MTEKVHITWEKSFPRRQIEEMVNPERGLYQFYGYHPVYGDDVLLYIGRTKEDNLKSRLLSHEFLSEGVPEILKPDSISIRVAYVPDLDVDIGAVEALLIFMHSPAWNSSEVRYTNEKYRNLEVYNEGDFGALLEVVKGRELFQQ